MPQIGSLVEVRGRRWVVAGVDDSGDTLVELQSVEDGRFDETLTVAWRVETDASVLEAGSLPDVAGDFDPPEQLAAFLDAVAWGAVTTADAGMLQAPFRSGVAVENYQLEPVSRALTAPRVNLLLADDVGLGKTIEAGLVIQELLLRQRARRVMIVCPAGLTVKWQQEMAEKFGIDFTIVNAEQCKRLRLTHGSAANPFEVYPFVIVSLPWLRGAHARRLLDEVLPAGGPVTERRFDVLVLDEAHHVAPAAPKQRYAVDSKQTTLIRWLAPHFEHRLFLSATPHNGYPESFTALLELIDDQRFARGVAPDETSRREVVVRRLKSDIVDADGQRVFAERADVAPLEVDYSESERAVHRLLVRFTQARRERLGNRRRKSTDLVTLLLKKRLFSSPAAFGRTVEVLRRGYASPGVGGDDEDWFDDYDDGDVSDEELVGLEETALAKATNGMQPGEEELGLLDEMARWAANNTANPDAKARKLIEFLEAVCRPDGKRWTDERVVVFTEYRDTQDWLLRQLEQQGMRSDRIGLLHGGLTAEEREALRQEFQSAPDEQESRVRILLATDAASEGIDLHWHCHRVVNYDIPFNPNKLEQRIGRIDRYGQSKSPQVHHFVSTGWEDTADTFAGDLEFLARVARKVAQIKVDLGAVNAVLAGSVQRRMLGQRVDVESELAAKQRKGRVPSDSDVRGRVARLRDQLEQAKERLNLTPAAVERVVRTALPLARQAGLTAVEGPPPPGGGSDYPDDAALFEVPALTGPWVRATTGLPHPLRPEQRRPVTFDPVVAAHHREDVVYAHLGHPLVAMSTGLLRAAVTSPQVGLARVTAVQSDDPDLESTLLGAFARFLIVGADGIRLHEEVMHAGGWLRDGGFVRERSVNRLGGLLRPALARGKPVPPHVHARLVRAWPGVKPNVLRALEARAKTRHESLLAVLEQRRGAEADRVNANLDRFALSLRRALGLEERDGYYQPMLDLAELADAAERRQAEADRRKWQARLAELDGERAAELAKIDHRYGDPKPLMFPVAVVAVVPRREVVR